MTEIQVRENKVTVVYKKGTAEQEIRVESPLAWEEEALYRPGGLWAYTLLGQRDRYLATVRKRRLRQAFGRQVSLDGLPLLASPFRIELLREDGEGRVGVVQMGESVYLVSTWGCVQAPESIAQRISRNRQVRLRGDKLRSLSRRPARAVWEEALREGLEAFLDGILAYGEEYLFVEEE